MRRQDWSHWLGRAVCPLCSLSTDGQGLDRYDPIVARELHLSIDDRYRQGVVAGTERSQRGTQSGHHHCLDALQSAKRELGNLHSTKLIPRISPWRMSSEQWLTKREWRTPMEST
jgi:hypothetical protein